MWLQGFGVLNISVLYFRRGVLVQGKEGKFLLNEAPVGVGNFPQVKRFDRLFAS
jgi:hypothetical protein